MSNHVALTDDERKEVVGFWADYFRSSGEGRQPTAFQLDAINDRDVRDAFLWWQLGADPVKAGFPARPGVVALTELFGDNPTGEQAAIALTKLIRSNNDRGVEIEDLDTNSVWVFAHLMWLLLGGQWYWAVDEATRLAELVCAYKQARPNETYPHDDPLIGLSQATALLSVSKVALGHEQALVLSAEMYGLTAEDENTRWARSKYAVTLPREESKNDAA